MWGLGKRFPEECHSVMPLENWIGSVNLAVICHSYNNFQKDPVDVLAPRVSSVKVFVRVNPFAEIGKYLPILQLKRFSSAYKIDQTDVPENIHVHPTSIWYIPADQDYKKLGERHYSCVKSLMQKQGTEFDLIHAHFTWSAGYAGARLKEEYGTPFVVTGHGYDIYSLPFKDDEWREKIEYVLNTADHIIIPKACYPLFSQNCKRSEVIPFDGYKEDIYIADYKSDPNFREKIPFDNYVVLRPEALGSFYVTEKQSIVPYLLHFFWRENVNVIYLPREKEDLKYVQGFDEVFIPEKPLNGLDLCYYADAVLTGSGTMAREAACMGKKAVSFFPSVVMLSVDKQLMNEGKIFHSRSPTDIVDYVLDGRGNNARLDLAESKTVKRALARDVRGILAEG